MTSPKPNSMPLQPQGQFPEQLPKQFPFQPSERPTGLPNRIRGLLNQRIGNRRADMWFDCASTVRIDGGRLAVEAESSFAADWIRKNFQSDLRAVSKEALGREDFDVRVIQRCPRQGDPSQALDGLSIERTGPSAREPVTAPTAPPTARARATEAWRRLEDFVVGPTNQMAFDAASGFAAGNAIGHCLVIHGGCGVGKSHLLQALCRRRRESRPQQRVRYVSAEQFTNEYIQSIRHGALDAFRARVRRVDVLAIDDVHFLAGKTATQTEFMHTLDAVQLAGSQVVLASDEHPHLVRRMSQSLISRMLAGMIVRIEDPDFALRQKLVKSTASRRCIPLSAEAVDALASRCVGGAREIEGAFASLRAIRQVREQGEGASETSESMAPIRDEVSCGVVEALFQRGQAARGSGPVRLSDIIEIVCSMLGVELSQLAGASRHRNLTLARALVAWLARRHTSMSFPEIARGLNRDSHSSMHTGAARVEAMIKTNATVHAGSLGACKMAELAERLRLAIHNTQSASPWNNQRKTKRDHQRDNGRKPSQGANERSQLPLAHANW